MGCGDAGHLSNVLSRPALSFPDGERWWGERQDAPRRASDSAAFVNQVPIGTTEQNYNLSDDFLKLS